MSHIKKNIAKKINLVVSDKKRKASDDTMNRIFANYINEKICSFPISSDKKIELLSFLITELESK